MSVYISDSHLKAITHVQPPFTNQFSPRPKQTKKERVEEKENGTPKSIGYSYVSRLKLLFLGEVYNTLSDTLKYSILLAMLKSTLYPHGFPMFPYTKWMVKSIMSLVTTTKNIRGLNPRMYPIRIATRLWICFNTWLHPMYVYVYAYILIHVYIYKYIHIHTVYIHHIILRC